MNITANGLAPVDYALKFRRGGCSPIPARRDGSKAPDGSWKLRQTQPASEAEILDTFSSGNYGIAIAMGIGSGNAECIDLDDQQTADQYTTVVNAVAPGLIDKLTQHRTPRPGLHLIYRCATIEGNQDLAAVPDGLDGKGKPKTKALIETRGAGGYIMAPGSPPDCHPSGRTYEHIGGPPLESLPTITTEEREILFSVARSFDRRPKHIEPRREPRQRTGDGLSPGDDYNQRAAWEDIIEPHGWRKAYTTADEIRHWQRPGKTLGTSATTGLRSQNGTELFYVFSSNAHPFEPQASYSKFAAYTLLNHNGDFAAAAKQLASEGYGDPPKRQGMPDWRPDEYRDDPGDYGGQDEPHPPRAGREPEPRIDYRVITSRELASGDYSLEFYITDTMVASQPLIVAGAFKTLKTSIMIDAAVSLAIGGKFLGKLEVPRACRVGVMSGESGLGTIQETAHRVCIAAGVHLMDCDNLIWSTDLPQFGQPRHLDAMRRFLTENEIEVVMIDPAYLSMPGSDAGNLMIQGALLRSIAEVCDAAGATMILAHHIKRSTGANLYDPPELGHIAWAGFAEFARQWWLIGRRERYVEKSGEHKLWLSIGGSAGHSNLWAVDVAEGVRSEFSERFWQPELCHPGDVRSGEANRKGEAKAAREAAERERKIEADCKAVVDAMLKIGTAETQTEISDVARISGGRTKAALVDLMAAGIVVDGGPITKDNKRIYKVTYALAEYPE